MSDDPRGQYVGPRPLPGPQAARMASSSGNSTIRRPGSGLRAERSVWRILIGGWILRSLLRRRHAAGFLAFGEQPHHPASDRSRRQPRLSEFRAHVHRRAAGASSLLPDRTDDTTATVASLAAVAPWRPRSARPASDLGRRGGTRSSTGVSQTAGPRFESECRHQRCEPKPGRTAGILLCMAAARRHSEGPVAALPSSPGNRCARLVSPRHPWHPWHPTAAPSARYWRRWRAGIGDDG